MKEAKKNINMIRENSKKSSRENQHQKTKTSFCISEKRKSTKTERIEFQK